MSQTPDARDERETAAPPPPRSRRHPFRAGDAVVYLGPRSNRTWGRMERSLLVVGGTYEVEDVAWATATDGEPVPAVRLVGVRPVILETGRPSRSYAAENFKAAPAKAGDRT